MNIETSFYDERIDYYEHIYNPILSKYKGFGPVNFCIGIDGLRYMLNFWKEAKIWYIKKEQERIAREEGKKT
jgi:hypothetical protein